MVFVLLVVVVAGEVGSVGRMAVRVIVGVVVRVWSCWGSCWFWGWGEVEVEGERDGVEEGGA